MEEIKKQASNIDEEGNVLYLDEERLDRKEVPFPPYKNKPNGLGIYNWLKEHVIYMIIDASVPSGDKYNEYMLIDGEVVQVGNTSVDLTDYQKSADIGAISNAEIDTICV